MEQEEQPYSIALHNMGAHPGSQNKKERSQLLEICHQTVIWDLKIKEETPMNM